MIFAPLDLIYIDKVRAPYGRRFHHFSLQDNQHLSFYLHLTAGPRNSPSLPFSRLNGFFYFAGDYVDDKRKKELRGTYFSPVKPKERNSIYIDRHNSLCAADNYFFLSFFFKPEIQMIYDSISSFFQRRVASFPGRHKRERIYIWGKNGVVFSTGSQKWISFQREEQVL